MIEALSELALKVSGVVQKLKPGQRLNLPVDKAQKLFQLAKGRVRILDSYFYEIGDTVRYDIPIFQNDTHTGWETRIGMIQALDLPWHLIQIVDSKDGNWIWVNQVFVKLQHTAKN